MASIKIFAILSLFIFSLWASDEIFTQEEQQWIVQNPIVKVGGGPDWAPFDFVDIDGHYNGIADDYLTQVSKLTGLKFEVEIDKWSSNLQKMRDGKIDLLGAVYYTKERSSFMNYTQAYFEMLDYFFIRKDLKIATIEEMDGKIIAMPRGYAHGEIIKKEFPRIKILTVETFSEAIDAVLEKRADILFDTYAALSYTIKKEGLSSIVPFKSYRGHSTMKLHMTLNKSKPLLVSIVDKALSMITDNKKKEIYNRWLGSSIEKSSNFMKLTDKEKKWINENPIVTFSEIDWEPMSIIENGAMSGFMNDYLKKITQETGVQFKFKSASSWSDVLQKFKNGEIDIIPGIGESDYEAKQGLTSDIYANFPLVLVTKNRESFIGSIDELEEKHRVIAVPKYWTSYNYLKEKKPNIKVIGTKGVHEALDLVQHGKAYAFLGHMAIAMHYVGNYYAKTLHIAGRVEYDYNHRILLQNDKKVLLGIINKVFNAMSEKEHLGIKNKWLRVEVQEAKDYTLLYQIAGVFFLFLLGTLYWNRKLSLEIKERSRIEDALEIEKENFKALFEKVSDGNLIIKNGKFVTCNVAALSMLGLKNVEEILSLSPEEWSPKTQPDGSNSSERATEMIEICIKKGSHRFEWLHKSIDENEFWVDVGLTKIFYEGSDAIYVVWRDIREQKLLENSLKQSKIQMKTLIDSIPLHVIVTTYEGKILLANPQTLNDYEFDESEIENINMLEFYAEEKQRDEVIQEIEVEGNVDKKVVDFIRPDGIHSMLFSIIPIRYNDENVLLSIGVDISERLKMEEDLLQAKNIAELANKSKSEFLANMSHEIRTPMNAIIGFTELLSEQIKEPKLKTYVSTIQSSGYTLLTLINDILDLSKIEAGKLLIDKRPTDVFALASEISAMFMMSVRNKNIDFIVKLDENIPHSLLLDEVRVRQVLINIVGNAVKFTENGFVKLSIEVSYIDISLSKVDIKFIVQDSGIGIPKDKLESIFKEFEQNEGQDSRKFGGTGLGLSISQRLCQMMDGKISVSSVNGEGSTFEVALYGIDITSAVEEKKQTEALSLDTERILFKSAKVLVVDDVEDNRELIMKNFEDTEIEIFTADDGLEAIKMFKEIRPDLILMDIRMPNMNGFEASKEIKKISPVPIIALTASVMEDEFEIKKRQRFDGYLRKPVFKYELFKELSSFLEHEIEDIAEEDEQKFILSQKAKLNIVHILNSIDKEIVPLHKEVLKSNNIANMKIMTQKIRSLADEYEIEILQKYAYEFFEAIDVFDIGKIDKLLRDFEVILDEINS